MGIAITWMQLQQINQREVEMKTLKKHTETSVKRHLIHFLTLTVMLVLLIPSAYASNSTKNLRVSPKKLRVSPIKLRVSPKNLRAKDNTNETEQFLISPIMISPTRNFGMTAERQGELIDDTVNVIDETSIALDSEGNPHIGYIFEIDDNKMGIKYAYHDGTKWIKTQIDTIGAQGERRKAISLDLDSNDNPHFAYNDSEHVYYTYFRGDTWIYYYISSAESNTIGGDDNYTAEEPLLSSRSIAIDKGGRVHIVYTGCRPDFFNVWALRTLYHVVFNGSNFDSYIRDQDEHSIINVLGSRTMLYPGVLVLKNDDSAGIVYFKGGRVGPIGAMDMIDQLKFSHIKGGEHHIETLKEVNYPLVESSPFSHHFSAVLDNDNALSVCYEFDSVLKYMRIYGLDGGAHAAQTMDESNVKEGLWESDYSIALDSSGDPHIAFDNTFDYHPNYYLGYAWKYNNGWNTKILPPLGLGHFGAGVSMAIDSNNHKHISHIDRDTDSLYYTYSK